MARKKFSRKERPEFDQKLLDLARVTRVVKGGRRFRFRATLVIGNRNGKVGIGVAKGNDVSEAVRKAYNAAKKKMIQIKRHNNTIACETAAKDGSAKVMLKPARPGRGIVAGGAVRAVVELAGIRDIVSKSMGSSNKLSVARATVEALEKVKILSGRIQ
jgi:small subunit ribosomal protein S5